MPSIDRQFAVGLTALAGASVLAGAVTRRRGRRDRARRYLAHTRPNGSVVEVDVHLPPNARRIVLFDNGLGTPHEYWDWVVSALPADIGYLRFNRPGYGLSSPVPGHDLSAHFALIDELRARFLPSDAPVTLVGHSLGGYLVAAYAAFHGAGTGVERVVMVDATNVRQLGASRGQETDLWYCQILLTEQAYAVTGLSALIPSLNRQKTFRPEVNRSTRAFLAHRRVWATAYREYRAAMEHPEPTGIKVPLDVITAQDNQGSNTDHLSVQAEFLAYSERSRHHVIEGSDHESVLSFEHHAALVGRVIAEPFRDAEPEPKSEESWEGVRP
ncbi:alpha/beta hydrolase [Streptomyces sp. QH1-20]|uniref:alpha/beta hydrolase n=1 Tax=Streptomyces sp. QH1-20 TaxID=3240934 RepID=UPI003515F136